jgi:subtilisin family serine protease
MPAGGFAGWEAGARPGTLGASSDPVEGNPVSKPSRSIRLAALAGAVGLALSPLADAATLGPYLSEMLPGLGPNEPVEVIVTFPGDDAPTPEQVAILQSLGLKGVTLRSLPMAGVVANRAQIEALAARDDVRSVYWNAPLAWENEVETALTGVDRLRSDPNLRSMGLPYSGRGIGVLVNDSGIDGTHPDLKYPQHVVQNVAAQTNLRSFTTLAPITYLENMPNTDIGGGHGTHVAGTVGGTGAASSPAGRFEGVAPGAAIVGYGSGAALLILDTLGGFDYALTHQFQYNIRVVSNSFGQPSDTGTPFDPEHPTNLATKKLADRGAVVVFSAGNSGSGESTITGQFKKAPWVVTVAAGDRQGRLAGFSSRGTRGGGGTVIVDGETLEWVDRPTVTAPGVAVYSALATTADPTFRASFDADAAAIGAGNALYYTALSGTSMAAPHVSGIVALMLEANPALDWRGVKAILEDTATNIPGREPWEAGAGYVNAYAAVQQALALNQFGSTVNMHREFHAEAIVEVAGEQALDIAFSPVGPTETKQFEVAADVSLVAARANVGSNTVAIVLTDPDGVRYGSSIAIPVLGSNISVTAPGRPGTWSITVRGIGAVSGVAIDPLRLTNGAAVPGTVRTFVRQFRTAGFTGLTDIGGHPARGFIELAVRERLVDGYGDGRFRPDQTLVRRELADYLVSGNAVRQFLPLSGRRYSDIGPGHALFPFAEAVGARGAALRDTFQQARGVVFTSGGRFEPGRSLTREELAYALVQSLGLESLAAGYTGPVVVDHDGQAIEIEDAHLIHPEFRGYVHVALALQLIPARFYLQQGALDLYPTLKAEFRPRALVSRADYAAAAVRTFTAYER